MSRTKCWYVNCDGCGNEGAGGEGSATYGTDLAPYLARLRLDGWTFGEEDLCEECNGNGPKQRASLSDEQQVRANAP